MTFIDRVVSSSAMRELPARIALALVLLTSVAETPGQLVFFLRPSQPVIRLWSDPGAQYRLQLEDVPYDLLRAADAALPRDASVLLVTSGRDVRHTEYTTFHRALYFLAPRPVWWLAPALPDGTWESRWWISAPLTPESIRAVAAEKGASYVLTFGLSSPILSGRTRVEDDRRNPLRSPAHDRLRPTSDPSRRTSANVGCRSWVVRRAEGSQLASSCVLRPPDRFCDGHGPGPAAQCLGQLVELGHAGAHHLSGGLHLAGGLCRPVACQYT